MDGVMIGIITSSIQLQLALALIGSHQNPRDLKDLGQGLQKGLKMERFKRTCATSWGLKRTCATTRGLNRACATTWLVA
jgi:hypothetical protein